MSSGTSSSGGMAAGPAKTFSSMPPPNRVQSVSNSDGLCILENRRKSFNDKLLSAKRPSRANKSAKSFCMTSEGRPKPLGEKDERWLTVNTQVFGLPAPTSAVQKLRSASMGINAGDLPSPSLSRKSSYLSVGAIEALNMAEANQNTARSCVSTTTDIIKDKLAKLTLMRTSSFASVSSERSPGTATGRSITEGRTSPVHNVYSPDDDFDASVPLDTCSPPSQHTFSRSNSESVVEAAIEASRMKMTENRSFFLKEDTLDVTGGLNKKKKHPHYVRLSLAESDKGPVTVHLVRKQGPGKGESGNLFVMSSIMVLNPASRNAKNSLGAFVSSVRFDFLNQQRDSFTPVFNIDVCTTDLKGSGDIIALRRCDVPGRKDLAMMVQVSLASKMKHTKLCHVVFQVFYIVKPKVTTAQPERKVTEEDAVAALTLSSGGIEMCDDRDLSSLEDSTTRIGLSSLGDSIEEEDGARAPSGANNALAEADDMNSLSVPAPPKKRQVSSAYEEDCVPFYLQYLKATTTSENHFGIRRVDM